MTDNALLVWRRVVADRERIARAFVLVTGLALVVFHARRLWFYSEEDAYILARYVRNLAEGNGLVYNRGEREWGCTTTLLPLLLVPLHWLGIAPVLGAKLVGTASVLAAGVALAPYNANAWNNLGYALGVEGRFREAVPPLEWAIRLTPTSTLARNNLNWVRSKAH